MLSSADINALDLAHTHAQSAKKKGVLETVFINLYEKYKQGEVLDKVEERAIKDYLAVYRSEFALLKKQARMKNNADKIIDKQKKLEAVKTEQQLKAELDELKEDLANSKSQMSALSKDLEDKQSFIKKLTVINKQLKEKADKTDLLLLETLQNIVFDDHLKGLDDKNLAISTLLLIATGHIAPEKADKYPDSFNKVRFRANDYFQYEKKINGGRVDLVFFKYNNSWRIQILPIIFVRSLVDDKLSTHEKSQCIICLTSVPVDIVRKLLEYRLTKTKKPELYKNIDYSDKSYRYVETSSVFTAFRMHVKDITEQLGLTFEEEIRTIPIVDFKLF